MLSLNYEKVSDYIKFNIINYVQINYHIKMSSQHNMNAFYSEDSESSSKEEIEEEGNEDINNNFLRAVIILLLFSYDERMKNKYDHENRYFFGGGPSQRGKVHPDQRPLRQ